MTICFYGASSDRIGDVYKDACRELGYRLGKLGHSLIYGGGSCGLMGAFSQGMLDAGADVTGVVPLFMQAFENVRKDCTDRINTDDMNTRKDIMEKNADVFIVGPGGIGTFDEFFEAVTLKQLYQHNKKIILFNVEQFFDPMVEMMRICCEKAFIKKGVFDLFHVISDMDEVIAELDRPEPKREKMNKAIYK